MNKDAQFWKQRRRKIREERIRERLRLTAHALLVKDLQKELRGWLGALSTQQHVEKQTQKYPVISAECEDYFAPLHKRLKRENELKSNKS